MKTVARLFLLAALSTLVATTDAQRFPGRTGDSFRDSPRRERSDSPRSSSMPQEPLAALERELPSLKVDLMLQREQLEAWVPFERAVRDAAEIERARRRSLMALRDPEAPPPSAAKLIGMLAEEDRRKAEASALMQQRLDALYATLDETQRKTFDRRVILSQTETLGAERSDRSERAPR